MKTSDAISIYYNFNFLSSLNQAINPFTYEYGEGYGNNFPDLLYSPYTFSSAYYSPFFPTSGFWPMGQEDRLNLLNNNLTSDTGYPSIFHSINNNSAFPSSGFYAGYSSYTEYDLTSFRPSTESTPSLSTPSLSTPSLSTPSLSTPPYGPLSLFLTPWNLPMLLPSIIYPLPTHIQPASPVAPTDPEPSPAPLKIEGEWKSTYLIDENGGIVEGTMIIDRLTDQHVLRFQDSPLSLTEGQLQQFEYTPTLGEAPMSFRAEFTGGYTAQFSCTAKNSLCPQGVFCGLGGHFTGEGEYEIKDSFNQIADRGTFSLEYPVYHNNTMPEPDESIQDLGQPAQEYSKVLALAGGPEGRIYGSTSKRHLFVYDPVSGETEDLGNPGYECTAMTVRTDGLICLGGGWKQSTTCSWLSMGYANLAIYDPTKPWDPGTGAQSNPRDLGQAIPYSSDDTDGRPLAVADLVTAPDGKIYGSTAYRDGILNNYYAHLFVYNPQTDSITYLASPLSDQAGIGSLSFSEDGTLWGVILAPAENTYKEPLGKIFSYNPVSNSFTIIDSQSVNVNVRALTIGKDGLFYVAGSDDMNKIFTYDPASGSFEMKGSLGGGAFVMDMMCGSEGTIYIGSGCNGYFIHYNPEEPWDDKPYSGYNDTPDINPRMFRWTGKVNCMVEVLDGSIYFGTLDGHIYVFTSEEEAIEEP